jgi:hypothetical protein
VAHLLDLVDEGPNRLQERPERGRFANPLQVPMARARASDI